ncbi:hypothetical protein PFICI_08039 [Pestalotiopsis fici W106-1]|uniref:CENP-V/GFA domain-containing protein n=1 Tax=Pestalotiopsis fici (strain W106-1 / CGMCC3.15140) TaxID=1229662 RepID=W3X354_PESFW|nr:uncharacterized protein PFICI_08039 [Pestalotiopsis fici W106-1]ETS80510.1 hypothetical protein PFICI_08039 [Pestalotiopsis fici W106-1]
MATTTPKTGSCLCGAVKVKVTGQPVFVNLCHCINCQKATGTLFNSSATYQAEDVEFTCTSPDIIQEFQVSNTATGSPLSRFFCRVCGSKVRNKSGMGGEKYVTIPFGILDDKSGLKPQYEFFCANREDWFGDFDGVPRANGMEPVLAMAQGS